MNIRGFVILFLSILLLVALPVLLFQPSGEAGAGLAAGFTLPTENIYHMAVFVMVGVFSAWLAREAILIMPLSMLLMFAIGAMMHIDAGQFAALHGFILGAIILFALSISLLRDKRIVLFCIPLFSVWIYTIGNGYMLHVPSVTTPLFFLLGVLANMALMLSIGVSLGVALMENLNASVEKLKASSAIASFLSFF